PARSRQLDRQPRTARHVEEPVACPDLEDLMEGDVLPAVGRLAERRKVDSPTAPPLVDNPPVRPRPRLRHGVIVAPGPNRRAGIPRPFLASATRLERKPTMRRHERIGGPFARPPV